MIGFRTKMIRDRSKNAVDVFPNSTFTVMHSFLQLILGRKYVCPIKIPVKCIQRPGTNIHLLQSEDHFEYINTLIGGFTPDPRFKYQSNRYCDIWTSSRQLVSLKR